MEKSNEWYDNVDARWTAIGKLVEKHGNDEEKLAWALCRGDAAEWRLPEIKKKLEILEKKLKPICQCSWDNVKGESPDYYCGRCGNPMN